MALAFDPSYIDKSLPVPVGRQLYGLMSYLLSHGDLPKGTKLPSVRQMARDVGIAQATVSQVYQDLRDAGLLEMRKGSGAYTCLSIPQQSDHGRGSLRTDIEILLNKAERLGINRMTLVAMVNAQAQLRRTRSGLKIVFVAVFEGPGADYVDEIRPVLSPSDRISIVTFDHLRENEDARKRCLDADIVLTFLHRETELTAIIGGANILGLRFIPSNNTRKALASIDPRARVAAITQLEDYIAIMRPSVQRFAPHVADIRVGWSYAPDVEAVITESDVVIYATGADHITRLVRPGVPCFEYRHTPDPAVLENELVPRLTKLREALERPDIRTRGGEGEGERSTELHQGEMKQ
ncbi:MAG: GntR family transcriptional regulator [Roseicyclus sp.]|uniref:GntR family transcriptional regulator n=1 Tax=Boseongicola sp. H5 TaxID=2763261 RepID=UPI001B128A50|nr:GntR family transcriptional regulator [Boseongicola sp. H5]MBO6602117.1 GntR family transcriptional regulator [Roseicyclus sp.]MBO6624713.1 GntR family transcriptional regulator [Roseicyclus sp.]MBO6923391.1 GntR family transcriptional regulator [Roseicyclus sp.]